MGNYKGHFVMMHLKRTLPGSGGISTGDRAFTMRHGCLVPQTVEGPKLYEIDRVNLDAVLDGGESVLYESTWGGLVITDSFFFAVAKDGGTLVFEDRTASVPARTLWGNHIFSGRDWIMFEQALFILSPVSGLHVSVFKEGAEEMPPFFFPGTPYGCAESHVSGSEFLGDLFSGLWAKISPLTTSIPWDTLSEWGMGTTYYEGDIVFIQRTPQVSFLHVPEMLAGNADKWNWANGSLFLGGWVFVEPGKEKIDSASEFQPVTENVFIVSEPFEPSGVRFFGAPMVMNSRGLVFTRQTVEVSDGGGGAE